MKRIALTMAALLAPAAAAAQTPPPVLQIPHPPMVQLPPPPIAAPRSTPDRYAPFVRASHPVTIQDGRRLDIDFIVQDDFPALRFTGRNMVPEFAPVRGTLPLLTLLADRRLEPFWPAILEWAGPGLMRAVEADLALAKRQYEGGFGLPARATAESSVGSQGRALLQYASVLAEAGRRSEGVALLRARIADGKWTLAERTMLQLRLASILDNGGDSEVALKVLAEGEADTPGTGYDVNFTVNRAAMLAENGRFAEALKTIEAAQRLFDDLERGDIDDGGEKVPGSNRQFDWIRACALWGLDRKAEANVLIKRMRAAPEPRVDGLLPARSVQIRTRADLCMHDYDHFASEILLSIEQSWVAPGAWIWLQPGYRPRRPHVAAMAERLRNDPRIRAAMGERMRILPPEFTPALNRLREGG